MNEIKLYENKQIRSVWDEEKEEWYFSVVDVVGVLSESVNPTAYWRKLKQRLKEEGNETVTNCHALKMKATDGKMRLTDVADMQGIFRIIQSIPSPKAEPFKLWLAEVGKERIDEIIDPELTIDRALETYLKKGYSREWINQRLQAIQVRKELTDAWEDHGIEKGIEYAILTDEITKAWSGMTTRKYKDFKGLKKENLRDNMTTLEIVLNMLAEATTTELTKTTNPQGLEENKVHIIFTIEEVADIMCCATQKATKILQELDDKKGIGLVEKKRLGLGKANILYVKNFIIQETNEKNHIQEKIIHQELCISQLQNDENHNSGNVIFTKQEWCKSQCNKTNSNKTEYSKVIRILITPPPYPPP